MTTAELRASFLVEGLFAPSAAKLVYTDADRAIVGGVVPGASALALEGGRHLGTGYFCERREVGILNIGGPGRVRVDGQVFALAARDCLYVGRGSRVVELSSDEPARPAMFYILSYPAHREYPTVAIPHSQAQATRLGDQLSSNQRTIYKYIHPDGAASCQLTFGLTEVAPGSVWNTMPPHCHLRRSEVYFYFDLPDDQMIIHLMGSPEETRHLLVRNRQAVISPNWSIHSGAGTCSYSFAWGMGGENQQFDDMDHLAVASLR